MVKINSILFFVFCFNFIVGQKETDYWYFGNAAGLHFNNAPPVSITNGALYTSEGSASISDSNGNLLFYTDGSNVWNKNHLLMSNGTGLWGDEICLSSTQSAIIIRKPSSSNIYYIFTVDGQAGLCTGSYGGISYSIVDMNLSAGNGSVTSKNNPLLTPTAEKVTAVLHSNGTDVWVMTRHWGDNAKYAWLLTSAGINPTPIISNLGAAQNYTINSNAATQGYLKFSPDGKKLGSVEGFAANIELFDFNNSTGALSNLMTIYGAGYGLEFSSDGSKLYGTNWNSQLLQWDLTLGTETLINSSMTVIHQGGTKLGLQLGSDCRIYVATNNDTIGVIQNPNQLGLFCNYNNSAISLQGKLSQYGMPNFLTSYFKDCSAVGIKSYDSKSLFTISPNPFNTLVTVSLLENNLKQMNYIVRNTFGQIVLSEQKKSINNSFQSTIDLSSLPNGVYFLDILIDEKRTISKIIKQ